MEASPSETAPAGSDRASVAALGSGAAEAAAASSIAGARGGFPTGGAVLVCDSARPRYCVRDSSARVLSFRICSQEAYCHSKC